MRETKGTIVSSDKQSGQAFLALFLPMSMFAFVVAIVL